MDKPIDVNKIGEYFLRLKKGEIYHSIVGDLEKILIEKALEYSSGNQIIASKILGVNRNTLRAKIKKFNINVTKYKL